MRVVLLQDVRGVGRRYDIKNVSDGYARNFLIPKKLARMADEKGVKIKKEFDLKEQGLIKKYQNADQRLKGYALEFKVKTGERGEMFGAVTEADIKKALLKREPDLRDIKLDFPNPLKQVGEHRIPIRFGRGIKGTVTVKIMPQ